MGFMHRATQLSGSGGQALSCLWWQCNPWPEGSSYWNIVLIRRNLCMPCQSFDLDYVIIVTSQFNYLFLQTWWALSIMKSHKHGLFKSSMDAAFTEPYRFIKQPLHLPHQSYHYILASAWQMLYLYLPNLKMHQL